MDWVFNGLKTVGFKDDSDADSDSGPEIASACSGENYNETVNNENGGSMKETVLSKRSIFLINIV